jgi:mono/diheme cytochrome c family protein
MYKPTLVTASLLALLSQGAFAEEVSIAHGKELHDQSCTSCHVRMQGGDGSALYTRSNRRVTSISSLEAQVRRCESNLELKWFDEDIMSVSKYLNAEYYKLEK